MVRVILVVMVMTVCSCKPSRVDGEEIDPLVLAENYMLEFCNSGDCCDNRYLVVCRSKDWLLLTNSTGELTEGQNDIIFVAGSSAESKTRFFATGSIEEIDGVRLRFWNQLLISGAHACSRVGFLNSSDMWNHNVEGKPGYREKLPYDGWRIDPFVFLAFPSGDFSGKHGDSVAAIFYLNSTLMSAHRDVNDQIVGRWSCGKTKGTYVDVTFSREEHHRPVRIAYRLKTSSNIGPSIDALPILALNQVKWEKVQGCIVPVSAELFEFSDSTGLPYSEQKYSLQWKLGDEVEFAFVDADEMVSPEFRQKDPLEYARQVCAENWLLGFDEVSKARKENPAKSLVEVSTPLPRPVLFSGGKVDTNGDTKPMNADIPTADPFRE